MHIAAMLGDDEVLTLLLQYGADVNAFSEEGKTPLMMAKEYRRESSIDWLRSAANSSAN